MMRITEHAVARMRSQIAEQPLHDDEMRRIEGMGDLFMSLKLHKADAEGEVNHGGMIYWHQYTMRIDGVIYHFYAGVNAPSSATL